MRHRLTRATYYILLGIPGIYFGMLFARAFARYRGYYEGNWLRFPFDASSLLVGAAVCLASSLLIHWIVTWQTRLHESHTADLETAHESRITELKTAHESRIARFLATQKLEALLSSDLLGGLHGEHQITGVKRVTGAYSGAQVYEVYRGLKCAILKVAKDKEIENEYAKFTKHVEKAGLLCGPKTCYRYPTWGHHSALEYDLNWTQAACEHLTFAEMYRRCLLGENIKSYLEARTVDRTIGRLFGELGQSWWHSRGEPDVCLDVGPRNIYEEHYPFTRKFDDILGKLRGRSGRGQTAPESDSLDCSGYYRALRTFLNANEWHTRASDGSYCHVVVKAVIHGDLNCRNVLLEVDPDSWRDTPARVGLVDFSHTGNGLTKERTDEFIGKGISLDRHRGHIALDFCRLEADVKFCLTDLRDEQDLKQAWVLENLFLEHGLQLPAWEKLRTEHDAFAKWAHLVDPSCWDEANAIKFVLAWQSVRAIRDCLYAILQDHRLPDVKEPPVPPFHLALLRASLPTILYGDDRFHSADLQKRYLVLASGLLCRDLDEAQAERAS